MKFTFLFLVFFTLSSCANQARRRGPNLSEIENESAASETPDEPIKTEGSDRAPKGEIELGLEGEAAETVIIENSEEEVPEENPETGETAEAADAPPKKVEEIDCKKEPKHKSCVKKEDETDLIINPETPDSGETPE